MGSTGEFRAAYTTNGVQNVQNMFFPNSLQQMPDVVPVNGNNYYQSNFTSNPNPTVQINYLPNVPQHSNVMPMGNPNPNPGNYVSNPIESSMPGAGFAPNAFPMNNSVQIPQAMVQESYPTHGGSLAGGNGVQAQNSFPMQQSYSNSGAPLAGGNTVQASNPNQVQQNYGFYGVPLAGSNVIQASNPQVQQNYTNYGASLSGGNGFQAAAESVAPIGFMSNGAPPTGSFMSNGAPPIGSFMANGPPPIANNVVPMGNNIMVGNSGNFQTGSFSATDNYSTSFQPVVGNDCMQYGDPNAWNKGVQNTYETIGAGSQTNGPQESQSYSQPNVDAGVDPMTLQLEWEAYQGILNREKTKTNSDSQGPKQPTVLEGCKTTPCANFFSTYGCSNGENCQFSHFVSGGINTSGFSGPVNGVVHRNAVSNVPGVQAQQFPASGFKNKLCTRYASREGCKFGDKCHFTHGEPDLRVPSTNWNGQLGGQPGQMEKPSAMPGSSSTSFANHSKLATVYYGEPSPPGVTSTVMMGATSFTKLAIDAAYVGAIIGKAGSHIKQISKASGCKVSVREHETNSDLRNVEMEGSAEQIEKATELVKQLLQQKDAGVPKAHMVDPYTFKTRLCENFNKGVCSYGDRCLFAHGSHELRTAGR